MSNESFARQLQEWRKNLFEYSENEMYEREKLHTTTNSNNITSSGLQRVECKIEKNSGKTLHYTERRILYPIPFEELEVLKHIFLSRKYILLSVL